jgi:cbb3-type cytochrome oxidase subunit 3
MNGPLEWYAAISGIIAAFMIAGDFGRRVTGLGFLIFVTASIAWIMAGLAAGTMPLAVQNGILLLINFYGVWQYWLSPKNKKKIAVANAAIEQMEEREDRHERAGAGDSDRSRERDGSEPRRA